ncbi:unnamed protein product [Pleuronectes platessa]|uniref:Uncharacterized protein n=1 Tax=Pleuronectes platessa TaxID=8262 RepID=A0A9N7U3D1_PLEPL|nr:unnamed protein product [Pleuronectes platessa]
MEAVKEQTAHAQGKAEAAMGAAQKAQDESRMARVTAKQFSPSFQHPGNGMEVQRPKRQVSSEVEGEGLSSSAGTADSPDLYVKSAASDDPSNDAATPDLSPPSSSPPHTPPPPARPTQRTKSARFLRQGAVDHADKAKEAAERSEKAAAGGKTEIQVMMEGGSAGGEGSGGGVGKGEFPRANSWTEDKRRAVLSKGGAVVSGRGASRTNGHKHSSSNHKSREHGSSNHRQARGDRWTESSSSASWTSGHRGVHSRGGRLLEQDEEKISNYEMEMKPLQPRDSTTHKPHGHGEERPGHAHGEGRSHTVQRQRHKNRDGREGREGREGKEGGKDSSHKLDRPGEKMDPRPLRRDLTLSPPLKSSPISLGQQDQSLTLSKGNSTAPYWLTSALLLGNSLCLASTAANRWASVSDKEVRLQRSNILCSMTPLYRNSTAPLCRHKRHQLVVITEHRDVRNYSEMCPGLKEPSLARASAEVSLSKTLTQDQLQAAALQPRLTSDFSAYSSFLVVMVILLNIGDCNPAGARPEPRSGAATAGSGCKEVDERGMNRPRGRQQSPGNGLE